jgi:hypothetical protein
LPWSIDRSIACRSMIDIDRSIDCLWVHDRYRSIDRSIACRSMIDRSVDRLLASNIVWQCCGLGAGLMHPSIGSDHDALYYLVAAWVKGDGESILVDLCAGLSIRSSMHELVLPYRGPAKYHLNPIEDCARLEGNVIMTCKHRTISRHCDRESRNFLSIWYSALIAPANAFKLWIRRIGAV